MSEYTDITIRIPSSTPVVDVERAVSAARRRLPDDCQVGIGVNEQPKQGGGTVDRELLEELQRGYWLLYGKESSVSREAIMRARAIFRYVYDHLKGQEQ